MNKIEWLQHELKTKGFVTGLIAVDNAICYYRLSDGILKLRKRGWQIATEKIHTGVSQYARYWYIDEQLKQYMAIKNLELREVKGVMYVVDKD